MAGDVTLSFRTGIAVKLAARRSLIRSHATGNDIGARIAFRPHRRACRAPKHGELTYVRERVGKRPLNQHFRRLAGGIRGCEALIERC